MAPWCLSQGKLGISKRQIQNIFNPKQIRNVLVVIPGFKSSPFDKNLPVSVSLLSFCLFCGTKPLRKEYKRAIDRVSSDDASLFLSSIFNRPFRDETSRQPAHSELEFFTRDYTCDYIGACHANRFCGKLQEETSTSKVHAYDFNRIL